MATKRPNLIYIFADDMGYGDVSYLNEDSQIETPNLDRLGREGLVCRDAHSSSAVCTPSRYSLLTGRYNWRSRLKQGVCLGHSQPLLEEGRTTVASYLQAQGYHTACFGKWHLGLGWSLPDPDEEEAIDFEQPISGGPCDVGFDTFFGIPASLDMEPYVYVQDRRVTALPTGHTEGRRGKEFWRPGPIAPDFRHEEVLPKLTEKVISHIERRAEEDTPFFVYFPLPAPHTPILPSPEFRGKSGTNAYGDFVLQVDDVVGQVLTILEKYGLDRETILIFSSDNGCSPTADFEELAAVGHHPSYVFRGHKADIYEGGHRIPLLVRWPDGIEAGTVSDETVCLSDLLATMADLLEAPLADDAGEDSVSNLPIWQGSVGDEPVREATVHHSFNGSFSIRQGSWKLELCPGSGGWSSPKPGTDEVVGLPRMQLYNLDEDIGERRNRFEEEPEIAERLQTLLTRYVKEGRSTPGEPQPNSGGSWWPHLHWIGEQEL